MAANGDEKASFCKMPGGKKYKGTSEPESSDAMNCTMSWTPKISIVQKVIVAIIKSKKKLTVKPSSTLTTKASPAIGVTGASTWTSNNESKSAGMICNAANDVWPMVSANTYSGTEIGRMRSMAIDPSRI